MTAIAQLCAPPFTATVYVTFIFRAGHLGFAVLQCSSKINFQAILTIIQAITT